MSRGIAKPARKSDSIRRPPGPPVPSCAAYAIVDKVGGKNTCNIEGFNGSITCGKLQTILGDMRGKNFVDIGSSDGRCVFAAAFAGSPNAYGYELPSNTACAIVFDAVREKLRDTGKLAGLGHIEHIPQDITQVASLPADTHTVYSFWVSIPPYAQRAILLLVGKTASVRRLIVFKVPYDIGAGGEAGVLQDLNSTVGVNEAPFMRVAASKAHGVSMMGSGEGKHIWEYVRREPAAMAYRAVDSVLDLKPGCFEGVRNIRDVDADAILGDMTGRVFVDIGYTDCRMAFAAVLAGSPAAYDFAFRRDTPCTVALLDTAHNRLFPNLAHCVDLRLFDGDAEREHYLPEDTHTVYSFWSRMQREFQILILELVASTPAVQRLLVLEHWDDPIAPQDLTENLHVLNDMRDDTSQWDKCTEHKLQMNGGGGERVRCLEYRVYYRSNT